MSRVERCGPRGQVAKSVVAFIVISWAYVEIANGQAAFEDVTERVGLKGLSGGVAAWADFDRDGYADVYVSGQLWKNDHGERFERIENLPLSGPGIWGDWNNEGWPDLFSWSGGGKLFRNNQGQTFEAVNGIPESPIQVSVGATWGDFNGDSFLDLYVGGYEVWPDREYPDVIYFNDQGQRFTEHWRQERIRRARGITAADFDEDGDLDVYVSNYRLQANMLLRNDGRGNFTDVAATFGVAGDGDLGAWGHTIGSAWGDLDNDGHLDLFVGNFSHPPAYQDRPKFLRNQGPEGDFHFEDRSESAGLRWQESYASPAFADFDNDGDLDLFFTTVYPGDTSVLYENQGDWHFQDVTAKAGVGVARTYQAAWADYDNDGDVDLMTGGRLFRNLRRNGHWLEVQLIGAGSVNRAAIGAQVRIPLGGQMLTRQVEGATGQGNQNDLTLHFGLGAHTGPISIHVRWPDGTRQTSEADVDRRITIEYGRAP